MHESRSEPVKAVFVTGATSGIGLACAGALGEAGFRVFGGVEPGEDAGALERTGAEMISLDVTDRQSLAAAYEAVCARLGEARLWGLVNCAGVVAAGPVERHDLDEAAYVFAVNVLGVFATSQIFLPRLRQSRGRIVNISSLSGLLAVPFMGPYSASKAAIESLSDTMRRELEPLGVHVIAMQPGVTRTPMWNKADEIDLSPYRGSPYEAAIAKVKDKAVKKGRRGQPAERVARQIVFALTAKRPPTRIRVQRRWASNLFYSLLPLIPARLIDHRVAKAVWDQ